MWLYVLNPFMHTACILKAFPDTTESDGLKMLLPTSSVSFTYTGSGFSISGYYNLGTTY